MFPYGRLWSEAMPEDFFEIDLESQKHVTKNGLEEFNYDVGTVIGKPERTSLRENTLIYKLCPRKDSNFWKRFNPYVVGRSM